MNIENAQELFAELLTIINKLRSPHGCPWDRQQTHETLIKFLIEESQEAIAAIEENNMPELAAELGDILLQVVLHSEIASERLQSEKTDGFDINTVLKQLISKLIHRHPHVFGDIKVASSDQVLENWQKLKAAEQHNAQNHNGSFLDTVPASLSQLTRAYKYQIKASMAGFDWDNIQDVFHKITEELNELSEELENGSPDENIENEIGDLFFSVVNLCRFLKIHPENALRRANLKFYRRFSALEKQIGGVEKMKKMSLEALDLEWDSIKSSERD